ncbi:10440_t:CDS:2 [Ambispora leptoticha]|uniref:10440_t:CDS:1 n=1 Tax=Ambispora leptoticha TaxID=144679 RepID=A0A9N9FYY3_9GLOM|nr:10440_t:CDS:2 [Ambispora leptoticha]
MTLTSILNVALIDHDSNLLQNLNSNKGHTQALLEESIKQNEYIISPYQINRINFRRYLNESIAETAKNIFGIPQTEYDRDYAIETNFQTSNYPITDPTILENALTTNPELLFYASLSFALTTHQEPKIGQKKNIDLLGILSALGGTMSSLAGVGIFLFGIDRVKPWGFCQRIFIVRDPIQKKLYKTLGGPKLPLVGVSDEKTKELQNSDENSDEKASLKDLQKQLNNLELLLCEYIIDHSYLDETQKNVDKKIKAKPLYLESNV